MDYFSPCLTAMRTTSYMDEIWMHFNIPETKEKTNMVNRSRKKPRCQEGNSATFWDTKGITNYLKKFQTISGKYYGNLTRKKWHSLITFPWRLRIVGNIDRRTGQNPSIVPDLAPFDYYVLMMVYYGDLQNMQHMEKCCTKCIKCEDIYYSFAENIVLSCQSQLLFHPTF